MDVWRHHLTREGPPATVHSPPHPVVFRVAGMANLPPLRLAPPPQWVAYEDGIAVRESSIPGAGRGVFATRMLAKNTVVLVEAGVSGIGKHEILFAQTMFAPALLFNLAPRARLQLPPPPPPPRTPQDLFVALKKNADVIKFDFVELVKKKVNTNMYGDCFGTLPMLTSNGIDKPRVGFISYKASMFNAANTLADLNVTYGLSQPRSPDEPVCMFFVTSRDVNVGEELCVSYGNGCDGLFAGRRLSVDSEQSLLEWEAAREAFNKIRYTVPQAAKEEIMGITAAARDFLAASDAEKMSWLGMFSMSYARSTMCMDCAV